MAKYRVRWKHIFWNIGVLLLMVRTLQYTWPDVRDAAEAALKDNPDVADFIATMDEVYRVVVERKR